MKSSPTLARLVAVASVGSLVALLVAACGGKIAPSSEDARTGSAGPYAGTDPSDTAGVPTHRPASAPVAVPSSSAGGSASGGADRGATWVSGPIGFVVQDSFSFDTGPTTNRELRGVWITSFAPACDKTKATAGSGVLRIDFSEQAGTVPPGTYPLEGPAPADAKTAYAQVWWVTAAGCGKEGTPGARFESGSVTIERSDAMGMAGSFQGILVDFDGNSSPVNGHFDAPRCPTGGGACTP